MNRVGDVFARALVIVGLVSPAWAADGPGAQTRPVSSLPASETVTFPTKDNLLISGSYTPARHGVNKAPFAILLHMYNSNHRAFAPLVPLLHEAGFAVLAVDLRGHGQSAGSAAMGLAERVARRDKKLFEEMDADVEAAYAWMVKQSDVDPARFVLVGASVGCSVALDYAARDRAVDGVVCLTPGTSYLGLDSLADARKCAGRPLLLMASEEERAACDQLKAAAGGGTVEVIGRAGRDPMALHGTRMFGKVADVEAIITRFLVQAVGPAPQSPVFASIQGQVYYPARRGGSRQISPANLRWFNSPEEAEARGFRPPKSRSPRSRSPGGGGDGEAFPPGDESSKPR